MKVALAISGSDSCGGAGAQADLKTFAAFGVWGASAITSLTAQNTLGVNAVAELDTGFVAAQIDSICDDLQIAAAKSGMLSRIDMIEAVADRVRAREIPNLVVDPVMVAANGAILLAPGAVAAMREHMFPLAAVVTPNLREAEILLGRSEVTDAAAMRKAARDLVHMGARAALITGGALDGDALDILFDGRDTHEFKAPRARSGRAHGAGCTLSAAIAAGLARGETMLAAIATAKAYVTRAIQQAPALGHGSKPLNHMVSVELKKPG